MKRMIVLGLLLSTVLITGCYDDINRSQSDINLVAEYIADVLSNKEYIPEPTTKEPESQAPTQEQTQKPTQKPTEGPTNPGDEPTTNPPGEEPTESPTDPSAGEMGDSFEASLGLSNVAIRNTNVVITKQYMESNGIIGVDAAEGKTLIVLEFEVKNTSDLSVTINTKNVDTSYKLILNDSDTHIMRMATGLNSELINSKNKTIEAGGTITTIMAFQVNDDIANAITKIDLCCHKGEDKLTINIR